MKPVSTSVFVFAKPFGNASPFVTAIQYEYYDADLKEWKVEPEPLNETGSTAWKKPARVHLLFERGALKATKVINLPIKRSGASTP